MLSSSGGLDTRRLVKEWSHVGKWLASKNCRLESGIEQNIDTLKSFLVLATGNESADDERELAFKLERGILESFQTHCATLDHGGIGVDVEISPVEKVEPDLVALAALHSALDMPCSTIGSLARELYVQWIELFDIEQALERSLHHQKHLLKELGRLQNMSYKLQCLAPQDYQDPSIQISPDLQEIEVLHAGSPWIRNGKAALRGSLAPLSLTIPDVQEQETNYTNLRERIARLEAQVLTYHGLPYDVASARQELDAHKKKLEGLSQRRNDLFEDLVERESPAKMVQRYTY